jgi:hypothetical protein
MKLIKSKIKVLSAAQTGRQNIVAAKMESFNLIDHRLATVDVAYFELLENKGGELGSQLYNTQPLNVTGSLPNKPNVKRIQMPAAQAQLIWTAIGGEVAKGVDLLQTLSDHFTTATLMQLVYDGNFVKIKDGVYAPLEMQDWEVVSEPALITQDDLDRWKLDN